LLDDAPLIKEGTPIVDLEGRLAGILHKRGHVFSMQDLRDDLIDLIQDAQGTSTSTDDASKNAWFGALLTPINTDYARKYNLDKGSLWVQHVIEDGPAARAGVQTGDLIVGVNDKEMRFSGNRAREYFMKTLRPRENEPFAVTVLRAGEDVICKGVFSKRPDDKSLRADDIGVTVEEITPGRVVMNNLFSTKGVYIKEVKKGSAAAVGSNMRSSLLVDGDVILSVANQPTPDLEAFSKVLEQIRRERPSVVLVSFLRGRTTGVVALNLLLGDNENNQRNDVGGDT
jgi:serine protease Do